MTTDLHRKIGVCVGRGTGEVSTMNVNALQVACAASETGTTGKVPAW